MKRPFRSYHALPHKSSLTKSRTNLQSSSTFYTRRLKAQSSFALRSCILIGKVFSQGMARMHDIILGLGKTPASFVFFVLILSIAVLKVYDLARKDDIRREHSSSSTQPQPIPPLPFLLLLRQMFLRLWPTLASFKPLSRNTCCRFQDSHFYVHCSQKRDTWHE